MSQQGEPKPGKAEAGLGHLSLGSRCGEGDPLQRGQQKAGLWSLWKRYKNTFCRPRSRVCLTGGQVFGGQPSRSGPAKRCQRMAVSVQCTIFINSLGSVEPGQEYGHN